MRYVMWIAEFSESSNLWTQIALRRNPEHFWLSATVLPSTLDGAKFIYLETDRRWGTRWRALPSETKIRWWVSDLSRSNIKNKKHWFRAIGFWCAKPLHQIQAFNS